MRHIEIIEKLSLQKHPEGGYYKSTYLAQTTIDNKPIGSSIYYLLERADKSHLHQLNSDELWHHYEGGLLHIHTFSPEGNYELFKLGLNLEEGYQPQVLIPKKHWMCAEVVAQNFVLAGCTLYPAFSFDEFVLATKGDIKPAENSYNDLIERFTLGN